MGYIVYIIGVIFLFIAGVIIYFYKRINQFYEMNKIILINNNYGNRLIDWWDDYLFLGEIVESIEDINKYMQKSGDINIKGVIKRYWKIYPKTKKRIKQDIKIKGLINIRTIERYIKSGEKHLVNNSENQ